MKTVRFPLRYLMCSRMLVNDGIQSSEMKDQDVAVLSTREPDLEPKVSNIPRILLIRVLS